MPNIIAGTLKPQARNILLRLLGFHAGFLPEVHWPPWTCTSSRMAARNGRR